MDVLTTYGEELAHCPKLLRNMVMGVLPNNLEEEILEKSYKPEFQTYGGIIAWAKRRLLNVRQKELSELSRRPTGGRVNALKGVDDSEFSINTDRNLVTMVSTNQAGIRITKEFSAGTNYLLHSTITLANSFHQHLNYYVIWH